MNMGGLFGGIMAIGIPILMNTLLSETTSSAPQQQQQMQSTQNRTDALRQAMKEQIRIQEERYNQLVNSMIDTPNTQLIDDPGEMALLDGPLEQMAADAGRMFDGISKPAAFWMANHDAWFSTLGYMAQSASAQPMPVSEQPLKYTEEQLQSLECVGPTPYGGKICPFPNMRVSAVKLETIEIQPPESLSGASKMISQFTSYKGKIISSFKRSWRTISAQSNKIPDIMTNFIDKGNQALPGLQGKVAQLGQGVVKRIYSQVANQVFGGLNQAVVNPDLAIEMLKMETIQGVIKDAVGESLPDPAKGAYLALKGRYGESIETLKQWSKEGVKDYIWDFSKSKGKALLGGNKSESLAKYPTNVGPHPDAGGVSLRKTHWVLK